MQRWYQSAVSRHAAAAWWEAGVIGELGAARARQLCVAPDGRAGLVFWRRLCAWLGVMLLAAATVCLVAANWDAMSAWAKLGGLQVLLLIVVGLALWPRLPALGQALTLALACVLLGALLALVGQIYQTGADPWQLFAGWALLMLLWVVAARSLGLWLFWLAVLQVGWVLWVDARPQPGTDFLPGLVLINLLALAALEAGRAHYRWLRRDLGVRLVAAALLAVSAGWATLAGSLLERGERGPLLGWLVAAAAIGVFYYAVRRDLAIVAMVLASCIVVATAQAVIWMSAVGLDGEIALAILALWVLAAGVLAGVWLRRLAAAATPVGSAS